jgi:hypothetical protein
MYTLTLIWKDSTKIRLVDSQPFTKANCKERLLAMLAIPGINAPQLQEILTQLELMNVPEVHGEWLEGRNKKGELLIISTQNSTRVKSTKAPLSAVSLRA